MLQSYLSMFFILLPTVVTGQTEETFITQIRDLVVGGGASFTEVALYKFLESDSKWTLVASNVTDVNGRIANLVTDAQFPIGDYKLVFQTGKYYGNKNQSTLYPYLDILFQKSTPDQILIVVSLSPYGYSAYKGVNGKK
ncbi:probable 5-hydroxyisourate hydrolase R09H10.3 [Bradysia coprophila]|uniref:probable 5-hydroxyisourate hydrolase R09H10.3 n=1 Tax=Bradysia coprophila TaxID=38358 RepID=UPI00187D948D|nr:probable 5-hydroxyisourate hydrolase R09H10.3 [Bradysia coprophila]